MADEYDVFISYQRGDVAAAADLEQRLISAGRRIFRDVSRLELSDHVDVVIPAAIGRSAVVLVLWSANSTGSHWVQKEALGGKMSDRYLGLTLGGMSRKDIPDEFRQLHSLPLEHFDNDIAPLIEEIDKVRKRRLTPALQVDIENRMPASGGELLIGRDTELAALDEAWNSGKTRLFVLDAMGGTGKTALINEFLARMASDGWRGAARVYCWSFYSQGTDDKRQGDADGFFDEALRWFGYKGDPITSANRRGDKLAELINARKTLLVLDGLEPLQYPAHSPGLEGKLKDDGLAALFKRLALQMNGMVIVTTRVPVPELKGKQPPAVERRELNQLSTPHGVELLRRLGVKAGEKELAETVGLLSGHALSLNLLATYCVKRLRGLLPVRKEIEDILLDPNLGNASHVMMRRYEILLEELAADPEGGEEARLAARELAILYLIGLFDRPAEPDALAALKREPIAGLTDAFGGWDAGQWDFAVAALRDVKLLLPETVPGEIDAHPLVREYFGKRLGEAKPEAFRVANLRLYEHYKLKDIPPAFHEPVRYGVLALAAARPRELGQWFGALMAGRFPVQMYRELPPALRGIEPAALQAALAGLDDAGFKAALAKALPTNVKGMEPLFAAIAHGCAAGAHDAAFREVYFARVTRGNDWYATKMLGAFGADLSALAHFFSAPFATPSPNLAPADQSVILAEAAFRLSGLGRLSEAAAPLLEALKWSVAADDWHNAAIRAGNLRVVRLAIGRVAEAEAAARDAVAHADRMDDKEPGAAFQRLAQRTTLADALHQAGRLGDAATLFADAEARQRVMQPSYPLLYSVQGAQYCDLLLSQGHAADVRRRSEQTLEWATRAGSGLLDIAVDTLSLGRAALAEAEAAAMGVATGTTPASPLGGEAGAAAPGEGEQRMPGVASTSPPHPNPLPRGERGLQTRADLLATARTHLDAAIDGLYAAGATHHVPRGYVARAELFRVTGDHALAAQDLDDAQEIADRSGMKLLQCDIALERTRLALASRGDAAGFADRADALITETGYARRTPDLALVRAAIAIARGDAAAAARHLADAKRWIDDGWRCHVPDYEELMRALASGRPAEAPVPAPPPADILAAPAAMQVSAAQLAGARHVETYRDCHIFALADGRVYLDGLIAVATIEHARATLDIMLDNPTGG